MNAAGANDSANPAERILELDGLRGVAIALVLWHHLIGSNLPLGREHPLAWLRAATEQAWVGVDLFFVLSGFLIGGILFDGRASPRFARVFYLRRGLRILPLYYVTLFVLLYFAQHGGWKLFPGWVYAAFLTNFALATHIGWDWAPLSVLWSLAVEEQFYLLAPWVVRAFPWRRIPWLLLGIALAALLVRTALTATTMRHALGPGVLIFCRMDSLALGALAAWAARDRAGEWWRVWLTRFGGRWLLAGATGVLAFVVAHPTWDNPLLRTVGFSLYAATFALLVSLAVLVRPRWLSVPLSFSPLRQLGRRAYFVYLWHMPIWLLVIAALSVPAPFVLNSLPAVGTIIAALAAIAVAAEISWRCFERPLIAIGHRQTY